LLHQHRDGPSTRSTTTPRKAGRATVDIACALIGGWDEHAVGDKELISDFTNLEQDQWQERTRDIWDAGNGPLQQQDGRWRCVDHKKSIAAAGSKVTVQHLEAFKPLVLEVLKEVVQEAEEGDVLSRFLAKGPYPAYSSLLKEGLAETLAILGSEPVLFPTLAPGRAQQFATDIVREVLSGADWKLWSALDPFLPLLAEAAPLAFLDAVEEMTDDPSMIFPKLCSMESDGMFGRSRITGILWALETLAWPQEHFNQAVLLLARLASQDTGGRSANRPANSLTTILLPWLPQTKATNAQRNAAIKRITRDHEAVGWVLLLKLLPDSQTTSWMSRKPRWREWVSDDYKNGVDRAEYWENSQVYASLALSLVGSDVERLTKLITVYAKIPPDAKVELMKIISSDSIKGLAEEQRQVLWTALNKLSAFHRRSKTPRAWHLTDEELAQIDSVAEEIMPTRPEVRYQRLFSGDEYALFMHVDYKDVESLVNDHRSYAVKEILAAGGIKQLEHFATLVKNPWQLGLSLAYLSGFDKDKEIIPSLVASKQENIRLMAGGFALLRIKQRGWGWFDEHVSRRTNKSVLAVLLTYLPFTRDAWSRASQLLGAHEGEYWEAVRPQPYDDVLDIEIALMKLIDHGRADAALKCLGSMAMLEKEIPTVPAVRALKELSTGARLDGYELGKLITALQQRQDVEKRDMLAIEWKFMALLDSVSGAKPVTLSEGLAADPSFFCEVIRAMYRSEKEIEEAKEPTQQQRDIALNAYRLLSEWRLPPGNKPDGTFDPSAFASWLVEVRRMTTESGHWESAKYQIGEVSFYTPVDQQTSLWPEVVCEELDRKENERMRDGLRIEIFNSPGVHSAGGGVWYRAQAERWKTVAQSADEHGYSYLGKMLRSLSDSYFKDADQELREDQFRRF
jgi:hypothetical protein